MMGLGGGGGSSGGTIVGGPSANSELLAGQYQSQAAQAAMQAATSETNSAINSLQSQYNNAFMDMKPYTSEGIQAMDQLNSYLGMSAYNPGRAPVGPQYMTPQDYIGNGSITSGNILNYIQNNTVDQVAQNGRGQSFLHPMYIGSGLNPLNPTDYSGITGYLPGGLGGPNSTTMAPGVYPTQDISTGNTGGLVNIAGASNFYANPTIQTAATNAIAQQDANNANATYGTQYAGWQQQMDLYNQAEQAYQNSPGPLSSQQIQQQLMNQPGVNFQYNQGLNAIQNAASAKGMLGSGRLLQSLSDYGSGFASQQYGQTLSNLAGLVSMGNSAASSTAAGAQNLGTNTANAQMNLGNTIANGYLAQGQAQANALTGANQNYSIIGGGSSGSGLSGLGSLLGGASSLLGSSSTGGSGLLGLF